MDEPKGIYVDIDALFDTRFALLSVLSPELARGSFQDKYFTRKQDSFGFIPNRLFRQFYKKRNRDLLKLSRPTSIPTLIAEHIDTVKLTSLVEKVDGEVVVFINIFPYVLNDKEIEELRLSFLPYFVNCKNILIMSKPNIRPEWISKNCMMMIKYDGIDWVNRNIANGELIRHQLMDTILYLPTLMDGKEELTEEDFEQVAKLALPCIRMEWLETRDFCIK